MKNNIFKSTRNIGNNTVEYVSTFKNIDCTFRHHLDTDKVEIKFDDNFSKCNGYKNREDLIRSTNLQSKMNKINFGIIPEWLVVDKDGNFMIELKSN